MNRKPGLTFIKGDVLVILLVLLIAAAVMIAYIPRDRNAAAAAVQIWQDGKLVREAPVKSDARFEVKGEYLNTVTISGGRVCIEDSDCPGADCVHSGWISEPGRSIVCLPNRVEVRITGASEVDFAVG